PGGSGDLRGPDFFGQRVTDDPELNPLFDPQQQRAHGTPPGSLEDATQPLHLVDFTGTEEQEQQPAAPAAPAAPGAAPQPIVGPRTNTVTAEALEQLGVVVISAANRADAEAVLRIIEYIQRVAEVQIELVTLDHADATSVAATLAGMFQQIRSGPARRG